MLVSFDVALCVSKLFWRIWKFCCVDLDSIQCGKLLNFSCGPVPFLNFMLNTLYIILWLLISSLLCDYKIIIIIINIIIYFSA